jgi:hypothetical protein
MSHHRKPAPTLFSREALAAALGKDRRTIAKALIGVPPDGYNGRFPAWTINTAMRALDAAGGGGAHSDASPQDPSRAAVEKATSDMLAGFERMRRVRSLEARRAMLGEIGPLVGKFINALDADAARDPPDQRAVFEIVRDHLQRSALGDLCDLIECDLTSEGLVARTHTTKGARSCAGRPPRRRREMKPKSMR